MRLTSSILFGLLLLGVTPAGAAEVEVIPGVTVVGWERLPAENRDRLRSILDSTPRAWYSALRVITIDGAAIPEPLASETCARFPGYGPCKINLFAGGTWLEYPFPSDAPDAWIATTSFVQVVIHELAHQTDVKMWYGRYGTLAAWRAQLLKEAGCEPLHYLRSQLPRCYFTDYPQEFLASIFNQWGTCSRCVVRLALSRWDRGIRYPLDQVIWMLAVTGFRADLLDDGNVGTVMAYDLAGGLPMPELWSVSPWACGGPGTISGPGFALTLTTDASCHVTAVTERTGL